MKKNKFIIIGLLLIIFPIFFNGQHTQAYTYKHGKNTTLDKIVAKNLQQVYSAMNEKIDLETVAGYGKDKAFWTYVVNDNKAKSCGSVAMPNTIIKGGVLTCKEFLVGKGDEWSGIISKTTGNINYETAASYFKNIGYTTKQKATDNGTETTCIVGSYTRVEDEDKKNPTKIENKLCMSKGSASITPVGSAETAVGSVWFDTNYDKNNNNNNEGCIQIVYKSDAYSLNRTLESAICPNEYNSIESLKSLLEGRKLLQDYSGFFSYEFKIEKKGGITTNSYMQKGSKAEVSKKILGTKTASPLSEVEVYNLYHGYIHDTDYITLSCNASFKYDKDTTSKWYQVYIKRNGKINENCHIKENRTTKYSLAKAVAGPVQSGGTRQYYLTEKNKSIKDLADAINALNLGAILSKVKDSNSKTSSSSSKTTDDKKTCYDAGVESMSWIICPAIDNTSQAVDGIEKVLRDWLQIDTNKVFKSQTYTAWEVFRNIANVALIIIFLIVIFSQLTGVGIDNYGIKKLLPKLIIMSLLINLSYVICEIAVDLSNILGVGLDDMFKGIGTAIRAGAGTGKETVSGIVAGLFTALGAAGAVGGTVITAISIGTGGGGVMLVISLILVLLVALVAVLMFFVMLGARMIIVIIFTVIAPVAFALYILPNTQNLFKKWWKIFQTALVVFPICGALYGASFIIKAIIFGGGEINFIWGLIAVCAPFLPFLLLPTLLKGALAGLGALGGTLTMLGNGLKKGLSQGNETIKGTDRYKAAQERNQERRIQRRAGINRNGEEIKMGRVGRFMRGGERGIARARAQYLKNQDTKSREDRLSSAVGFEAAQTAQAKAIDADKIKDYTMLINDRTRNGEDEDKLFGMYDDYMAKGDKLGALAVARIAGRRKDTAARFMSQKITGSGLTSDQQAALINSNNAHGDIFSSVAKEISTGENSRNYLESAPLGFEFASQVNKGDADTAGGYSGWVGKASTGDNGTESYDNLHNAVNNYVTDSKQLVGMKSGSLRELYDLASSGKMNQDDVRRLSDLAKETIKNKGTTGVWDTTKATEIENLAKLTGGAPSSTLIIHHSSGGGPRPGSKSSPI